MKLFVNYVLQTTFSVPNYRYVVPMYTFPFPHSLQYHYAVSPVWGCMNPYYSLVVSVEFILAFIRLSIRMEDGRRESDEKSVPSIDRYLCVDELTMCVGDPYPVFHLVRGLTFLSMCVGKGGGGGGGGGKQARKMEKKGRKKLPFREQRTDGDAEGEGKGNGLELKVMEWRFGKGGKGRDERNERNEVVVVDRMTQDEIQWDG